MNEIEYVEAVMAALRTDETEELRDFLTGIYRGVNHGTSRPASGPVLIQAGTVAKLTGVFPDPPEKKA